MQRTPHRLAGGGPIALLALAALALVTVATTSGQLVGRQTADGLHREQGAEGEARWTLALEGELPLRPELPLGVRIVDPTGAAVEGAHVFIQSRSLRAGTPAGRIVPARGGRLELAKLGPPVPRLKTHSAPTSWMLPAMLLGAPGHQVRAVELQDLHAPLELAPLTASSAERRVRFEAPIAELDPAQAAHGRQLKAERTPGFAMHPPTPRALRSIAPVRMRVLHDPVARALTGSSVGPWQTPAEDGSFTVAHDPLLARHKHLAWELVDAQGVHFAFRPTALQADRDGTVVLEVEQGLGLWRFGVQELERLVLVGALPEGADHVTVAVHGFELPERFPVDELARGARPATLKSAAPVEVRELDFRWGLLDTEFAYGVDGLPVDVFVRDAAGELLAVRSQEAFSMVADEVGDDLVFDFTGHERRLVVESPDLDELEVAFCAEGQRDWARGPLEGATWFALPPSGELDASAAVPFAPFGAAVRDARTGEILAVGTWAGARYDWTTGPRWKRPDLEPDELAALSNTLKLVLPEVLHVTVAGMPVGRDASGALVPGAGGLYLRSGMRDNAICILWTREPPVYQPPSLDRAVRENGAVLALLPQAYELEYQAPGVGLDLGSLRPARDGEVLDVGRRLEAVLAD